MFDIYNYFHSIITQYYYPLIFMAFSVPLIDNSTLMLGRDNRAIQMAFQDKNIDLPALGFKE